MAGLKDGGVSHRAARDRRAQLAAGVVAGAGAAIAATKAALEHHEDGGAEPVEDRTYRLRRKEPAPDGIRRVAQGRADDALEQLRRGQGGPEPGGAPGAKGPEEAAGGAAPLSATISATPSTAAKTSAFATPVACSPGPAMPR